MPKLMDRVKFSLLQVETASRNTCNKDIIKITIVGTIIVRKKKNLQTTAVGESVLSSFSSLGVHSWANIAT